MKCFVVFLFINPKRTWMKENRTRDAIGPTVTWLWSGKRRETILNFPIDESSIEIAHQDQ